MMNAKKASTLCALLGVTVSSAAQGQTASFHNSEILPITATLLDGFRTGLDTEIRLRKGFQQLVASYKTPEQYAACQGEVAMTEEGQKIMLQFANLPDNVTPAEFQRVMEKMDVEMKALIKQRCGADVNVDWPSGKRAAKLEEIEARAAAAVDPSADDPGPEPDGESPGDPGASELPDAAISVRAYQLLKERIVPFCEAYEQGLIKIDGNPVSIPGSGRNIYWVFTAQEAAAIAPRCKELMVLLAELL